MLQQQLFTCGSRVSASGLQGVDLTTFATEGRPKVPVSAAAAQGAGQTPSFMTNTAMSAGLKPGCCSPLLV